MYDLWGLGALFGLLNNAGWGAVNVANDVGWGAAGLVNGVGSWLLGGGYPGW
jgi:hypothetical protein